MRLPLAQHRNGLQRRMIEGCGRDTVFDVIAAIEIASGDSAIKRRCHWPIG
jgi:hypothetical protein